MGSRGVYFRVDEALLEKFTRTAKELGLSKSEALRRAMEMFIESTRSSQTARIRGLVRGSRLGLRELDEAYMVSR